MLTAIVGILLGNVLIATLFAPALQKLREILGKFGSIELPYRSVLPGAGRISTEEWYRAEDAATRAFNRLFREYVMSFNAFKKVGAVFFTVIIILACVVAWQLPLNICIRLLLMIILVGVILGAGLYLQRAIAPTPSQLVSIDFLQNNFANLHLSSLFDCSHLHINFGRQDLRDRVMHFSIDQDLMFWGYRFLVAVSNPECSRVYFVAYGDMSTTLNYNQILTPEIQLFSIPLGDFSFSEAMQDSNLLNLHFWLFIPTPKGWVGEKSLHPRILSDEVTSSMGGNTGVRLNPNSCAWGSLDENVSFERKFKAGFASWKFTRLVIPAPNSPQAILQMFRGKVEHCGGIQSHDYPSGIKVESVK
jgi:hypothetical protein